MGKEVEAPDPRDLGQEYRDTLEAQIDLAPDLFEAESNPDYGRSAYAALDLGILQQTMPEILALYEDETMPALARADAAGRRIQQEADIESLEQLAPRAVEAARAADPRQQALVDALNDQALAEIQAGTSLDPSLQRTTQQAIRQGQAARGMGYGVGDVAAEALYTGQVGEQLRRNRQQFATNVVGVNAATGADPFMAILGRSGVNPAAGIGVQGQGQSMNPGQIFNPESPYASAVYAGNQNAQQNANIATANANSAILGGTIGALGRIGGAAFG